MNSGPGSRQQPPGTVWSEDFEDHGNTANGGAGRYTSSSDFYGGSSDFFGRIRSDEDFYLTDATASNNIHVLTPYIGQNGDYYYAAEDVNDTNPLEGTQDGNPFKDVTFTGIDISNSTGLTFKGLFAVGQTAGCGASNYDGTDSVIVYYNLDGMGEVRALCFNADIECNGTGDFINEPFYYDPNCDGDGGEGTLLTNTFQEFSFSIPDGSSVSLRIRVQVEAGNEEFAFDYFRIDAADIMADLFNFYDADPGAGPANLLAGPVTEYDPMTTSGNSPQTIWVTTAGVNCESTAVPVVVDVNGNPSVTFTALDDLCLNAGVQSGLVGGSPSQGSEAGDMAVYSGPGVTNNMALLLKLTPPHGK